VRVWTRTYVDINDGMINIVADLPKLNTIIIKTIDNYPIITKADFTKLKETFPTLERVLIHGEAEEDDYYMNTQLNGGFSVNLDRLLGAIVFADVVTIIVNN